MFPAAAAVAPKVQAAASCSPSNPGAAKPLAETAPGTAMAM